MKNEPVNIRTVERPPINDEETLSRLDRYIHNPPENTRIFTITPKVAAELLQKYNDENRPKKPKSIAEYAGDMEAGKWHLTGDTIKFSDHPRLRDGQNRLSACVRSGASFRTHVVFGIADGTFAAMDQGKNRGGSDVLTIAGFSNTTNLAAAVRWAWLIENGRVKQRDTLKPDEVLDLIKGADPLKGDYRGLKPEASGFLSNGMAIHRLTGQPGGMVAGMLYCFSRANKAAEIRFAETWMSGNYKGGQRSIFDKLQKEITRMQGAMQGRTRVHDVVRAAMIVRAWNAFVERRVGRSSDFRWDLADDFPTISKG